MLSAIAARRARQNPQTPLIDPTPPTPSPPAQQDTPSSIPKRKLKSQGGNSFRKKKRAAEEKRTRYFAERDAFEREDDLIVVESDSDSDEEPIPPAKLTKRRAWSPSAPLPDSSDDGTDEEDTLEDPVVPAVPQEPVLSTFQPVADQNTLHLSPAEARSLGCAQPDEKTTLLVLAPADTLSLLGTYALTVVRGAVSLAAVELWASRTVHRVFAPRSSPVPAIRYVAGDVGPAVPDPAALPERLRVVFAREGAVIVLREARTGVEGLGRVCRTFSGVFEPARWHKGGGAPHLGLSGIHMLTQQSKDVQPFSLPTTWETALSAASLADSQPMVGLVKGPKKTGKSTFARTLLNRLLTRYQNVAFLECDLGQSEFTPGGMVALNIIAQPLFGPPFTHPTLPHCAHYIGATTPRASPSHYLAAIQSLLQTYRLDIHTRIDTDSPGDDRISDAIPLVVNTMGWTKGLGADLSSQIEDMVEPTHVFEVEAPVFEPGWPAPLPPVPHPFRAHETPVYQLEPIPTSILTTHYSAADHRTLSVLSYFHAIFPSSASSAELQQLSAESWNTALPLCARVPYEVDWSVAFEKVVLTGAGTEDVVSSEIERVLNGAVVGLVGCEIGTVDMDADVSASTIPYTRGAAVPSPSTSNCHGLALIRAISPASSHMHVLTPLPAYLLAKCRVLVKGELELPIWGMLDFGDEAGGVAGLERGKVPYLQWGKGDGIGGGRRRVRRNLMRKGQM